MKGKIVLFVICFFTFVTTGNASIIFTEILADPAPGLVGDANQDLTRSGTHDEFIELYNTTSATINISGWSISDAVATRHVFSAGTTLFTNQYLVIFGGGLPQLLDINWQIASSGALGLNNSADTITLFDQNNNVINQVIYGSIANHDESIVRFPELGNTFVRHSSVVEGQSFSPGVGVPTTTTPEPSTLALFSLGLVSLVRRKLS